MKSTAYFAICASRRREDDPSRRAQPYDFRRPDRIAKDQLRAIHVLHENFARGLASSLSAYLRAYVVVNLVSVEQLSFVEFSQCLPSPTCIVSLGMKPYDGNALLEINPALVFPILEMLLGGSGKSVTRMNREVTEIEQSILEGIFRIILNDLKASWQIGHAHPVHHRQLRDRAAATADSRPERGRGRHQHGSADRRERRDDEPRHPVDHHQDAASEVRPAVVGSEDGGDRSRSTSACSG